MKIERIELIRATNKQLDTLGLVRTNNSGWLKEAMKMDFTEHEIAVFRDADVRVKKISPVKELREQFRNLLLCIKAGERCAAEDHARKIVTLCKG